MKVRELIKIVFCTFALIGIAAQAQPTYKKIKCDMGWKHVTHLHNEAAYQNIWCNAHNGITEYENADMTRVDCLTSAHAVEFDFGEKWAESIGQSLHYGLMTNKKPMIVLILENPKREINYYYRVKRIADIHGIDVEFITDKILKSDNSDTCNYRPCKCHHRQKRK